MENYSLNIGNALNTAWEYAKKYGLLIAVIYLLVGMLACLPAVWDTSRLLPSVIIMNLLNLLLRLSVGVTGKQ